MSTPPSFTALENDRYARHFSLPGVGQLGQQKLKRARVLVIGTGGLGSPIALYLAAAGVGHLALLDFDTVQLSNLQRQILFSTVDQGVSKVTAGQERLSKLNPEIEIVAIQEKFSDENADAVLRNYDLVMDGSDNFKTRYAVNAACVRAGIPFVFGAIARFDAQISVFNFQSGPCYRCLFPQAPGIEAVANCADGGVLGVLAGTTGTLMAAEALKILIGIGQPLSGQMLTYDALSVQFFKRTFARNPNCETCIDQAVHHQVLPRIAIDEISWTQFSGRQGQTLIDVRTIEEFKQRSIKGAKNIPLAILSASISAHSFGEVIPSLDTEVLLFCQSGVRSLRAAELLVAAGYKKVCHVRGGLNERSAHHNVFPSA